MLYYSTCDHFSRTILIVGSPGKKYIKLLEGDPDNTLLARFVSKCWASTNFVIHVCLMRNLTQACVALSNVWTINYLTSVFSKTLEHVLVSMMWEHIEENEIITENQHGFRKYLNTTTQLLHVVHNATEALDKKKAYHLVSFDFSKAFDKVPHKLLIHKLTKYKFNKQVIDWIGNWLDSRTSRVVVNGKSSENIIITSGVPQGSVLGPLLFLLYINDITNNIQHSECRLYADDTLLCSENPGQDGFYLQSDINKLLE